MKKLFLSLSVLASLLVAGCSSDDAGTVDETDGNFTTHYMSVNIVSADGGQSRVTGYEDGSEVENKVNEIRFFFFTENGEAAKVKVSPNGSSYQNFYDWTPGNNDQNPSDNQTNHIESIVSATIVINTKEGDKLPRTMVAVLNPTDNLKQRGVNRLDALREFGYDYAKASLTTEGKFVMTNSVYVEGVSIKKEVCPVYIQNSNICDNPDDAKTNAVTIYVERNVAKVQVSYKNGTIDGVNPIELTNKDGGAIEAGNGTGTQKVYLKLLKWGLTSETDKGLLIKNINLGWSSTWWYDGYQYKRSSWAMNSPEAANKWTYSYTDLIGAKAKNFGTTDYVYTNENADNYSTGTSSLDLAKTKFIVSGVLVNESGTPVTLVRHLGQLFVDTYSANENDNLPNLKKSILNYLLAESKYYWREKDDNTGGRQQIDASDILIKANPTIAKEESKNNCYVHAELTTEAAGKTWYASETGTEPVDAETINSVLKAKETMGEALVWREGMTYYYSPIVHRNVDTGNDPTYGVVRNHWYKVNINAITGLGTPVYNPGDIIYPEKPEEDDHYIAAAIDILSWRIVSYDYTLDW